MSLTSLASMGETGGMTGSRTPRSSQPKARSVADRNDRSTGDAVTMPRRRRHPPRDRGVLLCGAGAALALCWLGGAVFLATGAVLIDEPSEPERLAGHTVRA